MRPGPNELRLLSGVLIRGAAYAHRFTQVWREAGPGEALARAGRLIARRGRGELNRLRRGDTLDTGQPLGALWQDLARLGAFHAAPLPGPPRIVVMMPAGLPQVRLYRAEALAALWPGAEVRVFLRGQGQAAALALQDATRLVLCRLGMDEETACLLYEARRLGLPVACDLDDPLMSLPALAGHRALAGLSRAERAEAFRAAPGVLALMAACDAVAVSTPALADEVRRFLPRAPVWVRRNAAPPQALAFRPPPRAPGPLRLAFATGSRGRGPDIAEMAAPLGEFLARHPGAGLSVIGPCAPGELPAPVAARASFHPACGYGEYLALLAKADAVLLPLADDPFNRCKSAVRVIDAFAAARPVIASPVGEAAGAIRPGQTGFLARTPQDWTDGLEALSDPDRARTMGQAGRAWLEAHRSPGAPGLTEAAFLDWGRG